MKSGSSRLLAVTKVVPEDWRYVRIAVQSKDHNHVVIVISKLLGVKNFAQLDENDKKHKQDA